MESNLIHNEPAALSSGAGQLKGNFLRYGAILPLAAVLTIGLSLTMAGLIATEFTPQDKTETAVYEINPVVEDIPNPLRTVEIDPLREVDVPPPPPQIEKAKSDKPKEEIISPEARIPDFPDPVIDTTVFNIAVSDRDAQPLVRIPPIFPPRFLQGDHSGYCKVRFDVSPEGQPFNVETTTCTSNQLKSATTKSVQQWKYNPKIVAGRTVARSGVETTIRFALNDERGELLPVPRGY